MKITKKAMPRVGKAVASLRNQLAVPRQSDAERKRAADWLCAQNSMLEIIAGGAPLQEVLNSLCLLIEQQVPGRMCSILLLDNESRTLRAGAAPSLPEEYARALDGLSIGNCAGSCGTAAFLGQPVIVSDVATDPLWAGFRDLALRFGIRACWSIPFFSKSGEILGTFAVSHHEPCSPTSYDQDLMRTAGHLASIATERRQTEATLRESEVKYRTLVEQIPAVTFIAALDEASTTLYVSPQVQAMLGFSQSQWKGDPDLWRKQLHPDDRERVLAEVVHHQASGEPLTTEYRLFACDGRLVWIREESVVARGESGKPLFLQGVMTDISARKRAEEELRRAHATLEMRVAERTANLAAANAQLESQISERQRAQEELRQTYERLREVTLQLEATAEEERRRIARELHDEFGQVLTCLKFDLAWLEKRFAQTSATTRPSQLLDKVRLMSTLVGNTMQTVQRMCTSLRPSILDDLGLAAALEWLARDFQVRTGIQQCAVAISPQLPQLQIEPACGLALFRSAQELLTNVMRHADASRVDMSLSEETGMLILQVRDNGRGVTERQVTSPTSMGLRGIRERASLLGGESVIHGQPGAGTTVTVRIPLA